MTTGRVRIFAMVMALAMATGIRGQSINGHQYVDLGLSVVWATCNVGASSPSGYGDYYAWGETYTKTSYDRDNCQTWGKETGDISGTVRDVARAKWGGTWRIPTSEEWQELVDYCTWRWTTQGGHYGYKITSDRNGKSIFLPAAGAREGTTLDVAGEIGDYWSSTPDEGNSLSSYYLIFYDGNYYVMSDWKSSNRNYGLSIRPCSGK